ncbi:MAG: GNAT family N-acetyltransferase [Anaerolineaceae bacterium]|nr:GNAT family N-acetyltransferase [Anaerolineaceae bacterium]
MTAILELKTITAEIISDMNQLMSQLGENPPLKIMDIQEIISSESSTIFLAVDRALDDRVVGMLTLAIYKTPTGTHSWIEDVVVDTAYRRQGIGERLTQAGIEKARNQGAKAVGLTSRPAREAANRLYQRMGFIQRQTNLYRLPLK